MEGSKKYKDMTMRDFIVNVLEITLEKYQEHLVDIYEENRDSVKLGNEQFSLNSPSFRTITK